MVERQEYEVVIVGGGPAGLAAGLYAARAMRRTLLLERKVMGGQIALTSVVENYPGFPDGINGFDLGLAMHRQAEKYGLETAYTEVTAIEKVDRRFRLRTPEDELWARAVIVTAGADPNRLGVPGEERLTGRGVSYCGTCDAAFFRDEEVAVVGGGDAAMDEALFIARYARTVHVIHRRDTLRASRVLQERAFANPKIDFTWDTVVERIEGGEAVERLHLRNVRTGEQWVMPVAAVFIFIGQHPNTDWLGGLVALDAGGHVPVNLWMETSVPGLFAAGDVRVDSARQVATAVGDGVTAAIRADHYLNNAFPERRFE
jgi:thioredoxin reductase (NADPH)